jgi:hypothetical protein
MSKTESKQKVSVATEREVITYSHMWHTSECLLKTGQEQDALSFHQFMASLVFTAFTLEAYLNHVGSKLLPCWEYLERSKPPKEKLSLIAKHLGVTVTYGTRPWKVMSELFEFRNTIAHGKSITFKPPVKVVSLEKHEADVSMAKTKWELSAIGKMRRAHGGTWNRWSSSCIKPPKRPGVTQVTHSLREVKAATFPCTPLNPDLAVPRNRAHNALYIALTLSSARP